MAVAAELWCVALLITVAVLATIPAMRAFSHVIYGALLAVTVIGFVVACLYGLFVLLVLCLIKPDPALNLDLHPLVIAANAPRIMLKLTLLGLTCCLAAAAWR